MRLECNRSDGTRAMKSMRHQLGELARQVSRKGIHAMPLNQTDVSVAAMACLAMLCTVNGCTQLGGTTRTPEGSAHSRRVPIGCVQEVDELIGVALVALRREAKVGETLTVREGLRIPLMTIDRIITTDDGKRFAVCSLTMTGLKALRRRYWWRPKKGDAVWVVRK